MYRKGLPVVTDEGKGKIEWASPNGNYYTVRLRDGSLWVGYKDAINIDWQGLAWQHLDWIRDVLRRKTS